MARCFALRCTLDFFVTLIHTVFESCRLTVFFIFHFLWPYHSCMPVQKKCLDEFDDLGQAILRCGTGSGGSTQARVRLPLHLDCSLHNHTMCYGHWSPQCWCGISSCICLAVQSGGTDFWGVCTLMWQRRFGGQLWWLPFALLWCGCRPLRSQGLVCWIQLIHTFCVRSRPPASLQGWLVGVVQGRCGFPACTLCQSVWPLSLVCLPCNWKNLQCWLMRLTVQTPRGAGVCLASASSSIRLLG